jgi:hypothetical protein
VDDYGGRYRWTVTVVDIGGRLRWTITVSRSTDRNRYRWTITVCRSTDRNRYRWTIMSENNQTSPGIESNHID